MNENKTTQKTTLSKIAQYLKPDVHELPRTDFAGRYNRDRYFRNPKQLRLAKDALLNYRAYVKRLGCIVRSRDPDDETAECALSEITDLMKQLEEDRVNDSPEGIQIRIEKIKGYILELAEVYEYITVGETHKDESSILLGTL